MQQGSVEAPSNDAEDEPPGILHRHASSPSAWRDGRRHGDPADRPGDALADGHACRARGRARVAGIFALGLHEFDAAYGFVSLEFAERLVGVDQARRLIQLRVTDIYDAPAIADARRGSSAPTTARRTGPT